MDTNHSMFVHAKTADAQLVGQPDTYNGSEMYPTTLCRRSEIIVDTVFVPLDPAAETPTMIQFYVGMYDGATMEDLPAFPAEGVGLESIIAGEAALIPAQWPEFELKSATDTVFEGRIELASVGLPRQPVQPGEAATITLYWHALQQVTEDYTGFIHLLNTAGNMIAQDNHPAQDGHFPTRLWPQGTVLSDSFCLALPTDLAEGSYELWGGLYRPESVRRLEATRLSTGERWKDDLVKLGTLLVADPEE